MWIGIIFEKCHDVVCLSGIYDSKELAITNLRKGFIESYKFQCFLKDNPEFILNDSDELTELLECCCEDEGTEQNYILIMKHIKSPLV
tara:strand:+ start:490 stop:753 length:264 start_codon:yes stop_codon:yes gene_type:complete